MGAHLLKQRGKLQLYLVAAYAHARFKRLPEQHAARRTLGMCVVMANPSKTRRRRVVETPAQCARIFHVHFHFSGIVGLSFGNCEKCVA